MPFLEGLERLDRWFQQNQRILPWRQDPSPYRVWISEIMLQQTQVATVVPYFERFMTEFPSVRSLARADEQAVLKLWAGLGYYSRARNLLKAARLLSTRAWPGTREEWLEVPGVGPYTAGAILSIAMNRPEAILDGNVERVLSRVRRVDRDGGDVVFKKRLWRFARAFVECGFRNGHAPSRINQALMELGATLCRVRDPDCRECPLACLCRARLAGDPHAFPPKRARKAWLEVSESRHAILDSRRRVLVRQGEIGEWRQGLWDCPETLPKGFSRRFLEKLGSVETRHVVTRHRIVRKTTVWRLRRQADAKQGCLEAFRWTSLAAPTLPSGSAFSKTIREITKLKQLQRSAKNGI